MKFKKLFIFGLLVLLGIFLIACDSTTVDETVKKEDNQEEQKEEQKDVEITFNASDNTAEAVKLTAKTEYQKMFDEATKNLTSE